MAIPRNQGEILALDNFRSLVQDLKFEDGLLMRFLRARDLDMSKAEDMLRKFVEWRVSAICNQRLGWTAPLDLLQIEMYLTGFDDEDRPVIWAPYGTWPSLRDILDREGTENVLKWAGQRMDNLHKLIRRTKHQQFVFLTDYDGTSFSKIFYETRSLKALKAVISLLQDYEKNFPELLHKAIIFNTPTAFMWFWKIFSPYMAPYTLSKIAFYGSGPEARQEWEAALFDTLPEKCIPPQYGGHANLVHLNQDFIPVWEEHCKGSTTSLDGNVNIKGTP